MLAPAILRTPGESTSKTPPSTAIGQEVTSEELLKYERLIPWDQQWVSRSENRVSSTTLRGLLRPSPMEMEVPPLSLILTLLTFSSRFFSTTLQTTTEARCGSEALISYKLNLQSFAIVQHSGTEVYAHANTHAIGLLFPSLLISFMCFRADTQSVFLDVSIPCMDSTDGDLCSMHTRVHTQAASSSKTRLLRFES